MSVVKLEDYRVELDNNGTSVFQSYIGKDKDDNPKNKERLVGHCSKTPEGMCQALNAIIRNGISQEGELSLKELKEFFILEQDKVKSWVKEAFNEK